MKLLETCLKELPFSRLIYSIYCDYIIEHDKYTESVKKLVKAFEGALPRAKKVSETEFNLTLHLYQSTMRAVCRNINLIFKIEKSLSLRFKEPRKEGEEYDARSRELALELEVEILRIIASEEEQNSRDGGMGELGKRDLQQHLNGGSGYGHDTSAGDHHDHPEQRLKHE